MNPPHITSMRWWHIESLIPIEHELFGEEAWTELMFWTELAAGHHYQVALDDDRVVGYAGLALSGDEAWVNNIAVTGQAQRRGIATTFMNSMVTRAKKSGVRTILLEVATDNGPAQSLYEAFGFDGISIRRRYYQPSNKDALVMAKGLTDVE